MVFSLSLAAEIQNQLQTQAIQRSTICCAFQIICCAAAVEDAVFHMPSIRRGITAQLPEVGGSFHLNRMGRLPLYCAVLLHIVHPFHTAKIHDFQPKDKPLCRL